jgi:type IV pilus assembly protein PilM
MAVTVGLDIGSTSIRAVALDTGKATPVIRRIGATDLPEGAVAAGEIMDGAAVTTAISRLWKEFRLPRKRVVVGIANQRVIVRAVDVPRMDADELGEALPFQVQEHMPIPTDEAYLDYLPVEEFTTPEGEPMMNIMAVAAQRDMVDHLVGVVTSAGLGLAAVDLTAFGLVRALFYGNFDLSQPHAVVEIGTGVTQVILVRGNLPRFVRLIQRGGQDFTDALVEEMEVDEFDAEQLKRRAGVTPVGGDVVSGDEDEKAREILTIQADRFIEDIRGSVNFYLTQSGETALTRVIVAGNGARLPHLANRLGDALGAPIEPARVLDGISTGKLSEEEIAAMQPVLPIPVGLALWGTE